MNRRVFDLFTGAIIGALIAFIGATVFFNKIAPKGEVLVTREKVYSASLVDENGNTTQSWDVVKCHFIVIGATLTDTEGKTFEVRGKIRISPK